MSMDDAQLDQAFPVESYRPVFPTICHAITQVLISHTANHTGQLSVWRHAMGTPTNAARIRVTPHHPLST